ncbi:MAG: hypothetical protein A2W26_03180 [Acidobacteria bacterium RBG_16_64_8]|nr:MAG: hypothetical protein A2W26_03180 [Acidobacteria bacterium RBG_16_64_8]
MAQSQRLHLLHLPEAGEDDVRELREAPRGAQHAEVVWADYRRADDADGEVLSAVPTREDSRCEVRHGAANGASDGGEEGAST